MSIFDRRVALKPLEYPEAERYVDAINHSYWLHSEWNFVSDNQDVLIRLTAAQRQVIERALLAISQIEVSVKKFWGRIGDRFPKPEIESVGATFAESEVRHQRAYSHLLEVLGLNEQFDQILREPVIQGRVEYLTKFLAGSTQQDDLKYTVTVAMFSLFIENVSLFSQFAIVKSFNKHLNVLKDIDNVIQATMKEEIVHAKFGTWLINQIRTERPEWFASGEFNEKIQRACLKAFEAESNIVSWIFASGEPSFLKKSQVLAFIQQRFNESLLEIGAKPVFLVDQDELAALRWLIEEIHAPTHTDFFYQKSVNYAKGTQSYSADSIF